MTTREARQLYVTELFVTGVTSDRRSRGWTIDIRWGSALPETRYHPLRIAQSTAETRAVTGTGTWHWARADKLQGRSGDGAMANGSVAVLVRGWNALLWPWNRDGWNVRRAGNERDLIDASQPMRQGTEAALQSWDRPRCYYGTLGKQHHAGTRERK